MVGNSALLTVLRQEIDRFNNLLLLIHTSLKDLLRAVKGEIIMSDALEEAYSAFLAQKVPLRWKVRFLSLCYTIMNSLHYSCVKIILFYNLIYIMLYC